MSSGDRSAMNLHIEIMQLGNAIMGLRDAIHYVQKTGFLYWSSDDEKRDIYRKLEFAIEKIDNQRNELLSELEQIS